MKFKVGDIWRNKVGYLYKIEYIGNGDSMPYPIHAKFLKYDDIDYFTKEGKYRSGQLSEYDMYDLTEYLDPKEYPEYYI